MTEMKYAEDIKWDILYLEDDDGLVVHHNQQITNCRSDALRLAREELGTTPYIISINIHEMDMNGDNEYK